MLKNRNLGQYKYIVGYGIGECYERVKRELFDIVKLDFLCDRRWNTNAPERYDNIPIIMKEEIRNLENVLVIIIVENRWTLDAIKTDLETENLESISVFEIIRGPVSITGKDLKEQYPLGRYEDAHGNVIEFDETISDKIEVSFAGSNNKLTIGKAVSINHLYIRFGNRGTCDIGRNTEIIDSSFYVSDAKVSIGADCLFASCVTLRTHDGHHIFNIKTHQRINYAQDILIGNQVWLGYNVVLLGGAMVGDGSVVGTGSITSSSFGEHQVIAGNPARVIREGICWSRDSQEYSNRNFLEECVDQKALSYISDKDCI